MKELRVCMESALPDEEVKKAWFTLPIDEEDVLEKLGVDVESDDYRIIETDVPFKTDIKENTKIANMDCFHNAHLVQEKIGYLPGEIAFMDNMTGEEFIQFMADMKSITDLQYAKELIVYFDIDTKIKIKKMVEITPVFFFLMRHSLMPADRHTPAGRL